MSAPNLTQLHSLELDTIPESMGLGEIGVSRPGQGVQRFQDRTDESRWYKTATEGSGRGRSGRRGSALPDWEERSWAAPGLD